jgi:hypothetical protein
MSNGNNIPQIRCTRDYAIFVRDMENRRLRTSEHKKLRQSMEKYGFLPCYPIVVKRDDVGRLHVKEGNHRLAFARELALCVYFVETAIDFDVPEINGTLL